MKKLTVLVSAIVVLASCTKNNNSTTTPATPDTNAPVITLKGSTNDTVSLNSSYTDPGANAVDNVDGAIGANVVVSGTINKDLVGEYRLYYNVKDAAGNAAVQMTRYVYVANDADYLEGVYNTISNCGASGSSSSTVTLQSSTTINNRVTFGILSNYSGIQPYFTVAGNAMTAPQQNGNGSAYFTGNGTIGTANGKPTLAVSYTTNSGNSTIGTWNCSANYNKQ